MVAVIDLPYGGEAFSMTILLPHQDVAVEDVVAMLDDATWQGWTAGLAAVSTTVLMPKFTLEYEIELNDVLKALGMGVAFTGAADFSGIVPGGGIWIDEVKHKTFLDVNEEGTEAAAVTSVSLIESLPQEFRVDRPFIFVITAGVSRRPTVHLRHSRELLRHDRLHGENPRSRIDMSVYVPSNALA
jgi:serpin B